MSIEYRVHEVGGNWSQLALYYSQVEDFGTDVVVTGFAGPTTAWVKGTDPHNSKTHNWFSGMQYVGFDSLIKYLDVRVDGSGDDLDGDGIAVKFSLTFEYYKKAPTQE